jgi:hypothetical protein
MINHALGDILDNFDREWIKRQRVISTRILLAAIGNSAYHKHGICNAARDFQLSPSSICKAQHRFPPHAFRDIHKAYHTASTECSRVFALDASKVHVPASFKKEGFKSRTNDRPVPRKAKRPMAMLTTLVDVHSKTIYRYTLTKHFNERAAAVVLLPELEKGDTVICDRGYFSFQFFKLFADRGIRVVCRLKRDAFKSAKTFYHDRAA